MMIFLILTVCVAVLTGEPKAASPKMVGARVECHGKLHRRQMSMGGETTGTIVGFNGIIWELKLPDDDARKFADQHDKKPVTVVGTLRCIAGTERKTRWIVDVTHLTDRNPKAVQEGATMTVEGILQKGSAAEGKAPLLSIVADGVTWPLDTSENKELRLKAESLTAKTVLVSGKVDHLAERVYPLKLKLSPETLEVAPTKTARLR